MRPHLQAGAFLALYGFLATPVIAGPIHCEGSYGDVELKGNLEIAQPCELNGTEVDGNIKLYEGGSLVAINAEIDGNISAKRADFVDMRNSGIDGNIKLEEMVGDVSQIIDSSVEGKIEVKKNRSKVDLSRNYVDGNVDANSNSGGIFLSSNVIDGNLKCDKNSPAPVLDNNSVAGKTEKQCDESAPSETPSTPGPDTGGGDTAGGDDNTGSNDTGDSDTGGNDTGGSGTGGSDTPVGGNEPPVLNIGTGGGGGVDFALLIFLLLNLLHRTISRTGASQFGHTSGGYGLR